jgi:hypothetical protein
MFALPITSQYQFERRRKFCWRHWAYFYEDEECPVCWREKELERQKQLEKKKKN